MKISLAGAKYSKTAAVENLFTQAIQRIETLPGVASAAPAISVPLEDSADLPFTIEGRATSGGPYHGDEQWRNVGTHYFNAFKLRTVSGRLFHDRDTSKSTPVVVINEAMAKKYWKTEDPIGQRITIGKGLGPQFEEPAREIVGVVSDVRERGLDHDPPGVMYVPIGQTPDGMTQLANAVLPMTLVVRLSGPAHSLAPAIEREIQSIDGQLAITKVRTFDNIISDATARQSFNMLLLGIFSFIALLLAAIGVYGLMSYSVEQRTQEIGIRMALGADQGRMVGMIVRQGTTLAIIGVAAGLIVSVGLTRVLNTMLHGIKSTDPWTFGGVALLLTGVAVIASAIPARRATKVDPVCALRYD
jgi:predicted permease